MHKIVALVEEHNISPNLIMNLDHTHQSIICRGYPSICIGTTQLVTITTSSSTYDHGCVPGQMTADVSDIVRVHNIYFGNVSTKMTHLMIYWPSNDPLFRPLDLMVNNYCKVFMKTMFGEWFAKQVKNSLNLDLKKDKSKYNFVKPLRNHCMCNS